MERWCVMFAGQSVQEAGMGRELLKNPRARAIIERLKPSLGDDLEALLTQTADAELSLTFNAQRAIHAHHLANFFAYKASHPELQLSGAIGHSMGIVAALTAAGAMTVEESGAFIRARAQAFSDVCKTFTQPMGLAAVSTDDFNDVVEAASEVPGVSVALYNTIGRGTLGGTMEALQGFQAKATAEDWPVKIKLLKVEGPYHTSAFTPCRAALENAAAANKLKSPEVPVFMGTSGQQELEPQRIRQLLAAQVDSCELHLAAVKAAYGAGCRNFLETAYKPQPITWLSDQLVDDEGRLFSDVKVRAIKTEDLG